MTRLRLDRILTSRGIGTRKEIHRLVRAGRVCVDGEVIRKKDQKFEGSVLIEIDGEPVISLPLLSLWHKPLGVVCTLRDPLGRRDLSAVIPGEWRDKFHPVGRLDQDTTGLLLFSRSGPLTQWLLHPRRGIARRYRATVEGRPDASLKVRLAQGVETSLGTFPAQVDSVEGQTIELTVREGKHRMVRRILANSGHPVIGLHRLTYGPFALDDLGLEAWRSVSAEELEALAKQGAPVSEPV